MKKRQKMTPAEMDQLCAARGYEKFEQFNYVYYYDRKRDRIVGMRKR